MIIDINPEILRGFIMAVIAILTVSNVLTLWLFWRAKSAVNTEIPCAVWEVSVKRRTLRELPTFDDDDDDINTMIGDML